MRKILSLALLLLFPLLLPAQNYRLSPVPRMTFFDSAGNPLTGGHVHTYIAGTTTPQATYSDSTGTLNANPVVFDSAGRANIWLDTSLVYRFDVHNSADVLQYTVDNIRSSDPLDIQGTYAVVAFSATPTFNAATVDFFQITLTGNVTSSTVSNPASGEIITLIICQDGTGGRTFAWPGTFLRPPEIGAVASTCSNSTFVYDGTNWRPIFVENSVAFGIDARLERVAANIIAAGTGDSIAADTFLLDAANRDVALSRGAANRLDLAAGDALRLDSIQLDQANGDVVLSRLAANIGGLATGDSFAVDTLLLDSANRDFSLTRSAANTATIATGDQLVASNVGIEFNESDTNPTCAANNFNIYADTSEAKLDACVNGDIVPVGGAVFVQTSVLAGDTVSNTVAETNFATNYSIPANSWAAATVYRVTARGTWGHGAAATQDMSLRVKLGATVLHSAAGFLNASAVASAAIGWQIKFDIICISTGAGGTVEAAGMINSREEDTDAQANVWVDHLFNTAVVTVNTTIAQTLQISAQPSIADAASTITLRQLIVEKIR